jgi:hypothetical protein
MSDHQSAYLFGILFKELAKEPLDRKKLARKLWKMSRNYDFCDDEMDCDKALVALGIDPESEP